MTLQVHQEQTTTGNARIIFGRPGVQMEVVVTVTQDGNEISSYRAWRPHRDSDAELLN